MLEVEGDSGKRIIKLAHTLIIPRIRVNLFSLQRVVDRGYLPVFGEVKGEAFIKKMSIGGSLEKVATMSVNRGRLTLDCRRVWPAEGIQQGLSSEATGI